MSASVFKRGSSWPCPCMSWFSLNPRLLFSMRTITGSGRWLFITNNGLKTTWKIDTTRRETYYTIKLTCVYSCIDALGCLLITYQKSTPVKSHSYNKWYIPVTTYKELERFFHTVRLNKKGHVYICTSVGTHHSLLHVSVRFNGDKGTPYIEQRTTGARHLNKNNIAFKIKNH